MNTHVPLDRRNSMDYGFASHVLLWVIGLMTVCATLGASAALWSLGRANYRKG